MNNKFRSDLSIAKNIGSASSGSGHWWHQRFTAVIMILSVFWLFSFAWQLNSSGNTAQLINVIKQPYHIIMLCLFILVAFYHASLGMQVIIEDYVVCRISKIIMLLCVQIFSIVTVIAFLIAILYLMTL